MASFKAKFPVLQELFAKKTQGGPLGPPAGRGLKHGLRSCNRPVRRNCYNICPSRYFSPCLAGGSCMSGVPQVHVSGRRFVYERGPSGTLCLAGGSCMSGVPQVHVSGRRFVYERGPSGTLCLEGGSCMRGVPQVHCVWKGVPQVHCVWQEVRV